MHTWDETYLLLKEYKEKTGTCLLPKGYRVDGVDLYEWSARMRYRLKNASKPDELYKVRLLNNIGFVWNTFDYIWDNSFEAYKKYVQENNTFILPNNCVVDDINIYTWAQKQRLNFARGKLRDDRKAKLKEIDFPFNKKDYNWELKYVSLKRFIFYRDRLPKTNDTYNKIRIGTWLKYQINNKKNLSQTKIDKLRYLGVDI